MVKRNINKQLHNFNYKKIELFKNYHIVYKELNNKLIKWKKVIKNKFNNLMEKILLKFNKYKKIIKKKYNFSQKNTSNFNNN